MAEFAEFAEDYPMCINTQIEQLKIINEQLKQLKHITQNKIHQSNQLHTNKISNLKQTIINQLNKPKPIECNLTYSTDSNITVPTVTYPLNNQP